MPDVEMSPNVYGIETEYSCMISLPNDVVYELVGSCHSPDVDLGLYQEPEKKGSDDITLTQIRLATENQGLSITSTGMLSNGGRFYIDPSGPEYATPETSSAEEAVHRTFDGDEIVLGALEFLREQKVINGFQLNRRIVDHNRSSRGIHLNTCTALDYVEQLDSDMQIKLATLNAVKGAIFGSGGLLLDKNRNTSFHHSPRLSLTSDVDAEYGSYKKRPLVRYPFKEDGALRRVETVTSDALNFAWPLRASLIATNAFIGLLEHGHGYKLPYISKPVRSARRIGQFGNAHPVTTIDSNGRTIDMKPLDVLWDICELALDTNDTDYYLDEESRQVLEEIFGVIEKMNKDPNSVADQVESVARDIAIKKKMAKNKNRIDSEALCRFDYAWDWLGGGIAEKLRQKNLAGWQGFSTNYSSARTRDRKNVPPKDTRAKIRGDFINDRQGRNDSTWESIDPNVGDLITMHPLVIPDELK